MIHSDKPSKKIITVKKTVNTNADYPCSSNLNITKPYARARAREQKKKLSAKILMIKMTFKTNTKLLHNKYVEILTISRMPIKCVFRRLTFQPYN